MAFNTHDLGPYLYAGNNGSTQLVANLFAGGMRSGLDIPLIGDSRVTTPTGRGLVPVAAINESFASVFGMQNILPIQTQPGGTGGGSPPAGYAVKTNTNGVGTVTANLTANGNKLPGNFYYYRPGVGGGGDLKLYMPDGIDCVRTHRRHAGGSKFFDKSQPLYIDFWVCNPDGAVDPTNQLVVQLLGTANTTLSWGGLISSSVITVDSLNQAGFKVVKYTAGPFTPDGNPYFSTNIKLNAALVGANNMAVIGSRIRIGSGTGIAFTPMGIGGVTVAGIFANADTAGQGSMANAGAAFAAMNFGAVMHIAGQNDAGSGVTQAQMKIDMLNAINTVRGWVGWNIPYIIMNNPQNAGLGSAASTLESTYYKSYTEIADTLPGVYVLNSRKILEEKWGWNDISCPQGLTATGGLPSPLVNKGEWRIGDSYSANDVVTTDGVDGVALTVGTVVGTFDPTDIVTQAGSGATGYFISEIGTQVYLRRVPGSAAFNASGALTGSVSLATRSVSAVVGDGLYSREYSFAGTNNDNPQDIIPRRYWKCINAHTGVWGRRPGSISRDRQGHLDWVQVYPWYDPADPAHWHTEGSGAWADSSVQAVLGSAFYSGYIGGSGSTRYGVLVNQYGVSPITN